MLSADRPIISVKLYYFLLSLLGLVALPGLFVPLMDNDSAHHANIALHMYLTGDYVNLIDNGTDYLDKPHLHFWLSAWSYELFGVTGFAYKVPSFLFSILGVYSVFRLGRSLYNAATGRFAALIMASAVSFLLSVNDVRMDAILTGCIAFASWQLTDLLIKNNWWNVLGAAAGLALGFSTKGIIGAALPGLFIALLAIQRKQWLLLLSQKWWVLIGLFVLFISPVLYCYYLQFNLHPEKIIRGKDHINGIRFILFHQSTERFSGGMGDTLKKDYLFFIHTFLWVFAPWSFLSVVALYNKLRLVKKQKTEWASTLVFIFFLVLVSISDFKLPHYLNSCFPFAAIFTADFLIQAVGRTLVEKRIFRLQLGLSLIILLAIAVLNFWSFQVNSYFVLAGVIILLATFIHFIRSTLMTDLSKAISLSVAAMAVSFFLLNTNFYPQLLNYQGGKEMADTIKGKIDVQSVYFWPGSNSASFDFYTKTMRQEYSPGKEKEGKTWIAYYPKDSLEIQSAQLKLVNTIRIKDYEITKLDAAFLNPGKREQVCSVMLLSEVLP
jgi:4-amino-4-deoxy-L-arabinose transferase-like glycosyltransferase